MCRGGHVPRVAVGADCWVVVSVVEGFYILRRPRREVGGLCGVGGALWRTCRPGGVWGAPGCAWGVPGGAPEGGAWAHLARR